MIFPFESEAARGDVMPDGLSLPDQLAYQFLKNLYDQLRRDSVSREQATLDKGKMTHKYNLAKEAFSQCSALGDHWAKILKHVEGAQTRYRMERTLENADILSSALDGVLHDYP